MTNDDKLVLDTIKWFKVRGLNTANPVMQLPKLLEEFGETVRAIEDKFTKMVDHNEISDGIGDQVVVVVGIMTQLGMTDEEILDVFLQAENLPLQDDPNVINKLVGLYGTLASTVLRGNVSKDTFVSILMYLDELAFREIGKGIYISLETAYSEIKDRLGMVIDGVYMKAKDLSATQLIELAAGLDSAQASLIWDLIDSRVSSESACEDEACKIEVA